MAIASRDTALRVGRRLMTLERCQIGRFSTVFHLSSISRFVFIMRVYKLSAQWCERAGARNF